MKSTYLKINKGKKTQTDLPQPPYYYKRLVCASPPLTISITNHTKKKDRCPQMTQWPTSSMGAKKGRTQVPRSRTYYLGGGGGSVYFVFNTNTFKKLLPNHRTTKEEMILVFWQYCKQLLKCISCLQYLTWKILAPTINVSESNW